MQLFETALGAGVDEQVADLDHGAAEELGVLGDLQLDGVVGDALQRRGHGRLLVRVDGPGRAHPGHTPASGPRRLLDEPVQRVHQVAHAPLQRHPGQADGERAGLALEQGGSRSAPGPRADGSVSARASRSDGLDSTIRAKRKSSSSISSSSATSVDALEDGVARSRP